MPVSKLEILSPAGSLAILKSAVNNGADAVYIGGKAFSARKNATNFSNEEIEEAIRYAHLYGAKVYVTVNTVISDSELNDVYNFVEFLWNAGADALIIQDLGVLRMVKKSFPGFEVHASTQMTIHNLEGALLAQELGFKRVVLSRELSFEEIRNISENSNIELEVFVHGALCMSYSGQCLMSSFIGGRSGNRGACAQPCRLPCTLCNSDGRPIGQKDKYLLSLKDLCLVEEMDALRELGVTSLKIEGRMKSAEYVSLVTNVYNKYRNGGKVDKKDIKSLESIFSRSGFTKGYTTNDTGRHMLNYDKNNDDVYNDIKPEVLSLAKNLAEKEAEQIPFNAKVRVCLGQPIEVTVGSNGKEFTATGTIPSEKALNVSLDAERVKQQISKTGATAFKLTEFVADIEDGVSLPVREINEVRRYALESLAGLICTKERSTEVLPFYAEKVKPVMPDKIIYTAEVRNITQAKAALEAGFDNVLVHYRTFMDNPDFMERYSQRISVILPPVMRDNKRVDISLLPNKIYATNLSQLRTFKGREISADFRLNVFNSQSAAQLEDMGVNRICLSAELNIRQISDLRCSLPTELVVYGRIPLMTVQDCVVKSGQDRCSCKDEAYFLKDRKGMLFPLFTDRDMCINTIYNSAPVYMADRLNELPDNVSSYRFIFTLETQEEIKEIFKKYKNREKYDGDFTRGHYYRGVQ